MSEHTNRLESWLAGSNPFAESHAGRQEFPREYPTNNQSSSVNPVSQVPQPHEAAYYGNLEVTLTPSAGQIVEGLGRSMVADLMRDSTIILSNGRRKKLRKTDIATLRKLAKSHAITGDP